MQTKTALPDKPVVAQDTAVPADAEFQVLTFKLENQEYALAVSDVSEILRMVAIARLPEGPECVAGIINLRGKIVPVIDLRRRFGMPGRDHTLTTPIIVARLEDVIVGLIVDRVSEVLTITDRCLEPASVALAEGHAIGSVAKVNDRLLFMISMNDLLTFEDRALLDGVLASEDNGKKNGKRAGSEGKKRSRDST